MATPHPNLAEKRILSDFLEMSDPRNMRYSCGLRSGCMFIAALGALLWSTELFINRRYKLIMHINEARYKMLYKLVFSLYCTSKRRPLLDIGHPKVFYNDRSCATCIQRFPATFTRSSVHLVGVYPRCVFRYVVATQEPFCPIGDQFFGLCAPPTAASAY